MTFIIYYDIFNKRYIVEQNIGWPCQNERRQFKTKQEAQIEADKFNKRAKGVSDDKNNREICMAT